MRRIRLHISQALFTGLIFMALTLPGCTTTEPATDGGAKFIELSEAERLASAMPDRDILRILSDMGVGEAEPEVSVNTNEEEETISEDM